MERVCGVSGRDELSQRQRSLVWRRSPSRYGNFMRTCRMNPGVDRIVSFDLRGHQSARLSLDRNYMHIYFISPQAQPATHMKESYSTIELKRYNIHIWRSRLQKFSIDFIDFRRLRFYSVCKASRNNKNVVTKKTCKDHCLFRVQNVIAIIAIFRPTM